MPGSSLDYSLLLAPLPGSDDVLKVSLDPEESLPIGRGRRGLTLTDPNVSIQHARVYWKQGVGFVIEDLGSAHGTWVDGECIRDTARPICKGTRLRFGDTQLEVRRKPLLSPIAKALVGANFILVVIAAVVAFWHPSFSNTPLTVSWKEPIRQGGKLPSKILSPPVSFLHLHNVDLYQLKIRRVTDFDYDGRDEVWFVTEENQWVVSFSPEGRWLDLGKLPLHCEDRSTTSFGGVVQGFPPLNCSGRHYIFKEGQYVAESMDGIVTWTASATKVTTTEVNEDGEAFEIRVSESTSSPLKATRLTLGQPNRLAGFLSERGIAGPIHYLICEGALPGMVAQARLTDGSIRQLPFGCLGQLKLSDSTKGMPVVVAFSNAGYEALLADVSTFYGGNERAPFVQRDQPRFADLFVNPGVLKGGLTLKVKANRGLFDPIPRPSPPLPVAALVPTDSFSPSTPAQTTILVSRGTIHLDPPGCADLEVSVASFECSIRSGCTGSTPFVMVRETGCEGEKIILAAGYQATQSSGVGDTYEVRVNQTTVPRSTGTSITSASVSWRTKQDNTKQDNTAQTDR